LGLGFGYNTQPKTQTQFFLCTNVRLFPVPLLIPEPLFAENIYASLPRTTRGLFTVVGADPLGRRFLYCNGNTVFLRDIHRPHATCDTYTEHPAPVTVAKFSPSGFYVASADTSGKVKARRYSKRISSVVLLFYRLY
jgi:hypothetical protein